MTKKCRADEPVYSLTREQAYLVMCLIELVEGKDEYISELHEKLGITGREGYSEEDSEALENADKHDQIRRYTERWALHNELQIATMGVPSFPRNGLVVVEKANNQNSAPDSLVSHLGQWVSVKDRLPEPGNTVMVWRQYGYVSNPTHPAACRENGIEQCSMMSGNGVNLFICDMVSTGNVTHWLDAPPLDAEALAEVQAMLRKHPAQTPVSDIAMHARITHAIEFPDD